MLQTLHLLLITVMDLFILELAEKHRRCCVHRPGLIAITEHYILVMMILVDQSPTQTKEAAPLPGCRVFMINEVPDMCVERYLGNIIHLDIVLQLFFDLVSAEAFLICLGRPLVCRITGST